MDSLTFDMAWKSILFICILLVLAISWRSTLQSALIREDKTLPENEKNDATLTSIIIPRIPFVWHQQQPLQLRTFKPKYHLTMCKSIFPLHLSNKHILNLNSALQSSSISELIEMDSTYLTRILLRRQIMADNPTTTLNATPKITPAIAEFYSWILTTYLPTRYPTMFILLPNHTLQNLVTNESIPLLPPPSPVEALKIIGGHIDSDILFMLPSSKENEGYILEGFVVCFPSGFDTSAKSGMTLREIHGSVPRYKEKLAFSMDRFFERLEVGRVVKRANVC
jgi:hypothetical protein